MKSFQDSSNLRKVSCQFLYEMGMDDRSATKETLVPQSGLKKVVRRIIGIPQEAIRILASRW